jgi:hypothetical protein
MGLVMPDIFWADKESLELYTDSAGGKDRCFGIYFQGQWTHELWSDSWLETPLIRNISFLELFPVVVALCLLGNSFANKKVIFHIDNQAVATIINKKTSTDPNIMTLM